MNKIMLLLAAVCLSAAASAIPARPVKKTVNVNGREVTLTLVGDEARHYWRADDGKAYRLTDDNSAELLDLNKMKYVPKQTRQMKETAEAATSVDGMRRIADRRRTQYTGQRRGLVILVNFTDKKMSITNPQDAFSSVMNDEDYKEYGQYGSVHDYFYDQSYGMFDFKFDVVGPVTLSNKMSYYGANDSRGDDVRPGEMAYEAAKLVDDQVNFKDYDWDGDGQVENFFIVYAGYGEAHGADKNTIWQHAWDIYSATGKTLYLDGVLVNTYACSSELNGTSGKQMSGVGTYCHEFSHCFGLPDFYCTNYGHSQMTMDYWSLMDKGGYGNDGYCPTGYTAYERWCCGWLTPKELTEPITIDRLADIEEEGDAYILYNQGNKNEYYMLYNVQKTGWNTYLDGHGMLVLHVDYDATAWAENTPNNNASHLRMTPICADNKATSSTSSGDPYPGTSRNTKLTDTSTPAATLFNKNKDGRKFMGKPIENITEKNGIISFEFDGGIKVADAEAPAVEAKEKSLALSWAEVDGADSYDIEYGVYDEEAAEKVKTYFDLTFDFGITTDQSADISGKLDANLPVAGFTGYKLYKGAKGLKFGSSSAKGYLTSPSIASEWDEVAVTVTASPYSQSSTASISIVGVDADDNVIGTAVKTTLERDNQAITVVLSTEGLDKVRVLATDGRAYVGSFKVADNGNPYVNPTLVEGVKDTELEVAVEAVACTYFARVRGVNSARQKEGAWSPYTTTPFIPTAISDVKAERKASIVTYTLDGRRIARPTAKGIYISDGKKVIR